MSSFRLIKLTTADEIKAAGEGRLGNELLLVIRLALTCAELANKSVQLLNATAESPEVSTLAWARLKEVLEEMEMVIPDEKD